MWLVVIDSNKGELHWSLIVKGIEYQFKVSEYFPYKQRRILSWVWRMTWQIFFLSKLVFQRSLKRRWRKEESLWKYSNYELLRFWIRRMTRKMEKRDILKKHYLRRICKTILLSLYELEKLANIFLSLLFWEQ